MSLDGAVSLAVLEKMSNDREWLVCCGNQELSSYNMVYNEHVTHMTLPADSFRHTNCDRLFKADPFKNLPVCQSCSSLKYYLNSRKRAYKALSTPDQVKRQSVSSTVPFDYLSPFSKNRRLRNMRRKIKSLIERLKISQQLIEVKCEQSEEIAKLVQAISKSKAGTSEFEKIYKEADEMAPGRGRGTTLRAAWDSDVDMFFGDQERNGKSTYY